MKLRFLVILSAFLASLGAEGLRAQDTPTRRVIVFIWDGLRTDDLTPEITPNYLALAESGVVFTDHRAV